MQTIAITDGTIRPWDDAETKKIFWHSSAHLMAEALEVETGFYYDVDFGDRQISDADLRNVEKKMLELAKSKETFERQEVSKADALKYFTQKGDKYDRAYPDSEYRIERRHG